MKKILSGAALAALLSTTAAEAGPSHQMYGGLGAGLQSPQSKMKARRDGNTAQLNEFRVADTKFGGSVFLGYRAQWASFFAGLELDTLTPVNYENHSTADGANNLTAYKVKAGWAFGGSLLVGYNVNKDSYLALRLGGEHREFKVYPRIDNNALFGGSLEERTKVRKFKSFAFTPGVVAGMSVNDCWEVSADYRLRMGRQKSKGSLNANRLMVRHTETVQTFMLRAAYKFVK